MNGIAFIAIENPFPHSPLLLYSRRNIIILKQTCLYLPFLRESLKGVTMKSKRTLITFLLAAVLAAVVCMPAAAASFSRFWKQSSDESWYIEDNAGNRVTNAWLCDDAVPENGKDVWYLLDEWGNMITDGLVQDGTGNYYSLETEHNGYYGMLRYRSGNYGGISLDLEGSHAGAFAAIKNADGVNALRQKYGLRDVSHISNSNIVYTSSFGAYEEDYSGTYLFQNGQTWEGMFVLVKIDKDHYRVSKEEYGTTRTALLTRDYAYDQEQGQTDQVTFRISNCSEYYHESDLNDEGYLTIVGEQLYSHGLRFEGDSSWEAAAIYNKTYG